MQRDGQYYTIRKTNKASTFATQLQNFYLENLAISTTAVKRRFMKPVK